MDWFYNFPDMSRSDLRDFKKSVDFAFTDFSRTYGEAIENFFEPLLMFLVWFEKFFINTPWPLIVLGIIFFGLFTPIAILMRLSGRDELRLKLIKKPSHWILRNETIKSQSFKHQF